MIDSKETIKNRMIKRAATLWGVPANEIEMSFDPVVSMLFGACASEIEKINERINESQARVTEKIIQLMVPETIFGPKPAHGIIKVHPEEDVITITPDFLFSFKKREIEKASKKFRDVFFSPIQKFRSVNAEIKYLAYGNTLAEVYSDVKEQQVLMTSEHNFIEKSTLYIGVTTQVNHLKLEDVSMYFENQDFDNSALFYHHLKNAKWYINEKEVKTISGFKKNKYDKSTILLEEESVKLITLIDQVKNNYERYYVTFCENGDVRKRTPKEIEDTVAAHKVKLEEEIIWIKIVFPQVINSLDLKSVFCSFNAFPVINRKKEAFTYKLKKYINILPIKSASLFLDVSSITNTKGQVYRLFSENLTSEKKGVYSFRANDISKLDERKAKEYVNHLIELLKTESASFSYLNNTFLNTSLKKLNQIIASIEEKVTSSSSEEEKVDFLSVTPYNSEETLFVEYWVTDGVFANSIKYGSKLKNYKTVGLRQKSTSMLTSTYSGKDALDMNERLQAYRRTLLSRNKIVTKEDVKSACFEFFGEKIKDVTVKNGYTIDVSLNKGLINCIEIQIEENKNTNIDSFEWDFVKNNLLLYLEKNSTSVFPFTIKKV